MNEKKPFTFKYEKSDAVLSTPRTPVKRVPYKDIFSTPTRHQDPPQFYRLISKGDFFEVYLNRHIKEKVESEEGGGIRIDEVECKDKGLNDKGLDLKSTVKESYNPSVYHYTAVKKSINIIRNDLEKVSALKEVEFLKQISSEYVIKYINNWILNQYIYIEVEYCSFGTLREYMNFIYYEKKSFFSKEIRDKILREVGLGLEAIHKLNIVHLDLKPENIFLSKGDDIGLGREECSINLDLGKNISSRDCDNDINFLPKNNSCLPIYPPSLLLDPNQFTLKIGDFNISRLENEEIGMDGDKRYMAPEVLDGICNRKSDVFSLGLIYLEILNEIILPSSGDKWINLRRGNLKGMKTEGPVRKMLMKDYKKRIDISKVLEYFK